MGVRIEGCLPRSRPTQAEIVGGFIVCVLEGKPPKEEDQLAVAWRDPDYLAHDRLIINTHSAFYSVKALEDIRKKVRKTADGRFREKRF